MRFDILTLLPGMFSSPLSESILGRAIQTGLLQVHVHDIRDWAPGRHKVCDDAPYGGGDGMVMKPEPVKAALEAVKPLAEPGPVVLLTPQGRTLTQELAADLYARHKRLVLICGRYAGVDERVRASMVDMELSIGDYVLSGGELAALVFVEIISRLVPGVLGNKESAQKDSFPERLEGPQYTRPAEFEGMAVPRVLLSGHHAEVERWRKKQALLLTMERRPDLFAKYPPDEEEKALLAELEKELRG